MNRELWEKYISQKRFPAFPCPRCKQGTLGYAAENMKIMEPPYSRAHMVMKLRTLNGLNNGFP
jgi:hypothetical protein